MHLGRFHDVVRYVQLDIKAGQIPQIFDQLIGHLSAYINSPADLTMKLFRIIAFFFCSAFIHTAAFGFCDMGLHKMYGGQAWIADPQTGQCIACMGLCKTFSPVKSEVVEPLELVNSAPMIPAATTMLSAVRIDASEIMRIAEVNPWAANTLVLMEKNASSTSLEHGVSFLPIAPTSETVSLVLAGASVEQVRPTLVSMPDNLTGQVRWQLSSFSNGIQRLAIEAFAIDKSGRILFSVYPTVTIEFKNTEAQTLKTSEKRVSDIVGQSFQFTGWRAE